jgi:hypothetical protein
MKCKCLGLDSLPVFPDTRNLTPGISILSPVSLEFGDSFFSHHKGTKIK